MLKGSFSIPLTFTADLSPSPSLVVYAIFPNGGVTADSIRFDVALCFQNQVRRLCGWGRTDEQESGGLREEDPQILSRENWQKRWRGYLQHSAQGPGKSFSRDFCSQQRLSRGHSSWPPSFCLLPVCQPPHTSFFFIFLSWCVAQGQGRIPR